MEAVMDKIGVEGYPAYKNPLVKWLGEVPEHWQLVRLKYLFKEVNERSFKGDEDLLSVSHYTGVTLKKDNVEEGGLLTNAETLEGYKKVCKGDLVSNIMLAWNGSLGFSPFEGITSPAYCIYRLIGDNNNKYFHYLLRSELYKAEFKRNSSGVIESRLRLYSDDFFRIVSILPPVEEQTAIANFLDRKTAQIDKAIAQKEKLIALLKERMQILIHKAVTRGLNPNVKMKDSGVEWIGEIPEHWGRKKLKFIVRVLKRIANAEGYDVLSITQKGIKVKDIESGEGQLAMDYSKYQLIFKGELAMNHMDLLTGYVDISNFDGVISPDYRVFELKSNLCTREYLLYLFQMCYKARIFYRYGQGVSLLGRWRFPAENFDNFKMPVPPIDEQRAISSFVEKVNEKVEKAMLQKRNEIEKLKEYKTTLINAAVTGKIKVC